MGVLKSGTSALMKLMCWHLESPIERDEAFCHQADYVSAHVRGARVRVCNSAKRRLCSGLVTGIKRVRLQTVRNIPMGLEKFDLRCVFAGLL